MSILSPKSPPEDVNLDPTRESLVAGEKFRIGSAIKGANM